MKIVLIHPPLDDPTLPYHSGAYLKGHLALNGFPDVYLRDINIEYINHLFQDETIRDLYGAAERRLSQLTQKPALDFQEQGEYFELLTAPRRTHSELMQALNFFRSRKMFLDYGMYVRYLTVFREHIRFVGALSYPADNSELIQRSQGKFSLYHLQDLLSDELAYRICGPFTSYFEDKLAEDAQLQAADLIGVSVVYDHQLYHSFHLARLIRKKWPEKRVIFGGTAASQMYKYLKNKEKISELFRFCDALIVGEGETAICEIAGAEGELHEKSFSNVITYDKARGKLHLPLIRYENVSALGAPDYTHPWELYLSPERGINYSPTRGCYWNRCTFCDYGLNTDKPTSPWRERRIDQVISDLARARKEQDVRYVYFAVDVMAPGYLERLSDAMLEARLDLKWSAELRMEKIFSRERCRKMAQAGCVCVSFGMESGNQRVLNLIDKGTKIPFMSETMKNFAASGIACQLMAFSGFPTETQEERTATHQFITDHAEYWSAGGLGQFQLTGTAIVARHPERFGITILETRNADIGRNVAYRSDSGESSRPSLVEEADASFDASGGVFPVVLGRPWAGGIDTLHSMIYYETLGKNFFKDHPLDRVSQWCHPSCPPENCTVAVLGNLVESSLDLNTIIANRDAFSEFVREQLTQAIEPTYASFQSWAESIPHLVANKQEPSYWLVGAQQWLRLSHLMFQILSLAAECGIVLEQITRAMTPEQTRKFLGLIEELEKQTLILLFPANQQPEPTVALSAHVSPSAPL
jgi:Radical SAM superfamily